MTRINLIPPQELCDQHLLAEFRELTRIPNAVHKGRAKIDLEKIPNRYTLGTGHVRFFYVRLGFLRSRYELLFDECKKRGFNITKIWPDDLTPSIDVHYEPSAEDIEVNRRRIIERLPIKPRHTSYLE